VQGLQGLQHLHISGTRKSLELLQMLPQLSSLQQLDAAGLQEYDEQAAGDARQLLDAIEHTTGLRRLALRGKSRAILPGISLHQHLVKLPLLQSLSLDRVDVPSDDAVHFTALTALTVLELEGCCPMGDLSVTAIACRLTGLIELSLRSCGLHGIGLWPAVASLVGLRHLLVDSEDTGEPFLTDLSLHLLAPLTNLMYLGVNGEQMWTTQDVCQQFLSGMPHLTEIRTRDAQYAVRGT
jgi:hypothetical protein